MTTIYLDHNATTPPHPLVVEAMLAHLTRDYGNASSAHQLGSRARCAVEEARERVAAALAVPPADVVFTSGGTEANNLAIQGVAGAAPPGHMITSAIEHSSVLDPLARLEREGWRITRVPVDGEGRVSPSDVAAAITAETRLVSIGWANNEIGTVQPIADVAALCHDRGVLLHSDAVQAFGKVRVQGSLVDLLSVSAHKVRGPKGVGALYVRSGVGLRPLQIGGSQERGRRGGTENVPGIAGFGMAATLAESAVARAAAIEALRERLWTALCALPGADRNSPGGGCLPNTLNVSFEGRSADALIAALDLAGVAVSSGSACAAGASEPSHVLRALGRGRRAARDAIRFSLGIDTTVEEIDRAAAAVIAVVADVDAASRRVPAADVDAASRRVLAPGR
jgi:cysteine desulfurase